MTSVWSALKGITQTVLGALRREAAPVAVPVSDRDLDKATRTLAGEARGEPREGEIAVAWVMRTRCTWDRLHENHPEHEWWGTTLAGVCTHPWQFSCWNGGPDTRYIKALAITNPEYLRLWGIVSGVMNGTIPDPCADLGGATHYKVVGTKASWDKAALGKPSKIIGRHILFNLGPRG